MGYLDNTGLAYLWGKIKAKIPTKTSDLTNDSGFLTSHQDVSGKLDKSGGTMTGKLTLDGAPTSNLHAATKKYVDDNIPNVSGKLDKSGGTMTGKLTLDGDPTSNLHAATKKYVDDSVSSGGALPSQTGNSGKFLTTNGTSASWATVDVSNKQDKITASGLLKGDGNGGVTEATAGTDYIASHQDISGKLDKSGGTMTGALTLSGAPSSNLHAATKKYVDDKITYGDTDLTAGTSSLTTGTFYAYYE